MDDVYVYCVDLPSGIHEMVTPCADGFTVYLNNADSEFRKKKAFEHAIAHIRNNDFGKVDVQGIEMIAHGKE